MKRPRQPAPTARPSSCCCQSRCRRDPRQRWPATPLRKTRSTNVPSHKQPRVARPNRACSRGILRRGAATSLFGAVHRRARVFQGGGNELTTSSLRDRRAGRRRPFAFSPVPEVRSSPTTQHGRRSSQGARRRTGLPLAVGWAGESAGESGVQGSARRDQPGPVRRGASCTATSAARPTGGRRMPSTAPYWHCSRAATSAPSGTVIRSRPQGTSSDPDRQGDVLQGRRPADQAERWPFEAFSRRPKDALHLGPGGAAISGLIQHLVDLAASAGGPAPLPEPPDTGHVDGSGGARAGTSSSARVARLPEQLRRTSESGRAVEQRAAREASWAMLEPTARPCRRASKRRTVRTQRERDPGQPPTPRRSRPDRAAHQALCDAFDCRLSSRRSEARSAHDHRARTSSRPPPSGSKLDPGDRDATARRSGSYPNDAPSRSHRRRTCSRRSTPRRSALARASAGGSGRRRPTARAARGKEARAKSVTVKPQATLKTEAEVETYSAHSASADEHVKADETVII